MYDLVVYWARSRLITMPGAHPGLGTLVLRTPDLYTLSCALHRVGEADLPTISVGTEKEVAQPANCLHGRSVCRETPARFFLRAAHPLVRWLLTCATGHPTRCFGFLLRNYD